MNTLRMYYQENILDGIDEAELEHRIEKCRTFLTSRDCAALVVFTPRHEGYRQWLCGGMKQGDQEEGGIILGLEGPVLSIQSNGCVWPGEHNVPHEGGIPPAPMDFSCVKSLPGFDVRDLESALSRASRRRIAVVHPEPINAVVSAYFEQCLKDVEWVDVTCSMAMIKARLSPLELDIWETNARLMDRLYSAVGAMLLEERTEYELAREITYAARRLGSGGEFVSYTTPVRVSSGRQGAPLSPEPLVFPGRRIGQGDRVNVRAWILLHSFYRTTLSRAWTLGEASEQTRTRWEAVRRVQERVACLAKPGATIADIAMGARAFAAEQYLPLREGLFLHGIGYDAEQRPCLYDPSETEVLTEGMVLAIEPTLDFGDEEPYCIGDVFLLEAGGARRLGKTTQEIIQL